MSTSNPGLFSRGAVQTQGGATTRWSIGSRSEHLIIADYNNVRVLCFESGYIHGAMDCDQPERLVLPYEQGLTFIYTLAPPPRRVLLLGLGSGDQIRFLRHHFPECEIWAVEWDRRIAWAVERHFSLVERMADRIVLGDAERVEELVPAEYFDAAIIDLHGPLAPATVTGKKTFYEALASRLSSDAWVAANLWMPEDADPFSVVAAMENGLAGKTQILPVPDYQNVLSFNLRGSVRPCQRAELESRVRIGEVRYQTSLASHLEPFWQANATATASVWVAS